MGTMYHWLEPFEEMADWASHLTSIPDDLWLLPMEEGKWSIAEVISHLYLWDRFIHEERLMKLSESEFTKPDPISTNQKASEFGKSGIRKEELLTLYIDSRRQLCHAIRSLGDDISVRPLKIGKTVISLPDYVSGMVEHDEHHRMQMVQFLLVRSHSL